MKLEKLENMKECFVLSNKKRFHLLKAFFKKWEGGNMPVVAGRLVLHSNDQFQLLWNKLQITFSLEHLKIILLSHRFHIQQK